MHVAETEKFGKRSVVTLIMLSIVGALNYSDRQILSVLIEPIRAELHFSDSKLGLLTGLAFAIFYAVFGLPAALMADRWHRIRLIAIACLIWSACTAATGSVRSFGTMALARFGVGIGEAGGTAPSLSVLADCFPRRHRPLVVGLFTFNGPVGVFIGGAFGAWAATTIGWRAAFWVLGAVGLLAAPLLLLTVRDPVRGQFDGETDAAVRVSLAETLRIFIKDPALRLVSIASGLSAFLSYGMLNWIPAYLMRVQHMPLAAIGTWFAPVAGIAFGIGMIGGGAWVTAAVKRAMGGYGRVTAICTALLIPFFAAALWVNDWHASLILMFMPMVFCTVFTPASLALAQELGPRGARATVAATLLLMFNIVGLGLGPLFVGMISDALKASQGVESLRFGLALLIVPAALAALAHGQLGRMLDKRTKSGIAHG